MSNDEHKTGPSLFYFCVYTTKPLKGDDMNILFFYPPTFSSNEQMKQVGLAQALVNFTR
jgi:hypothetical protein